MSVPVQLQLVALAFALSSGVVVALGMPDKRQDLYVAVREEEGREGRGELEMVVKVFRLFSDRSSIIRAASRLWGLLFLRR